MVYDLATPPSKRREIEVVRGRVPGVRLLCELDGAVIQIVIGPRRAETEQVPCETGLVLQRGITSGADVVGPRALGAQEVVREDECVVDVDPVAVDLVQGADLVRVQAIGRGGGVAQQRERIEAACEGVGDDVVHVSILWVALSDDLLIQSLVHRLWDDMGCVRRGIVGQGLDCVELQVSCPPCWSTDADAVVVLWE